MASGKEYLEFILNRLSLLDAITYRPMMGEYIIYYRGKIVGGIYDGRFLVKQTPASKSFLPNAPLKVPYKGAKSMLLVENTDDSAFLKELITAMEKDLPLPKKRGQP